MVVHGGTSLRRSPMMLLALMLICIIHPLAMAQTLGLPHPSLSQMVHTTWTARDGAPQSLKQIAQAPDGKLWLAGFSGLYTFDGKNFKAFVAPAGEPQLPSNWINSICITRDGTVWVGMYMGGVARIKDGHVTTYQRADSEQLFFIQQMRETANGEVWAISNRLFLVRFDSSGQWHKVGLPGDQGLTGPTLAGYFFDSAETLWVSQGGSLFRKPAGNSQFTKTNILSDFFEGAAEARDGTLWQTDVKTAVDKGRMQHFDREGNLLQSFALPEMYGVLANGDGSLWLLSQVQGLMRLAPESVSNPPSRLNLDTFTNVDGLASHTLSSIIQDLDGNIWIAGERGLDRFRVPRLVPFAPGLTGQWSACSAPDGTTWLSSNGNHLYAISKGVVNEIPKVGDIYSIACNQPDSLYALDHSGLWRFHQGRMEKMPALPVRQPYAWIQIAEARDGSLYARGNKQVGLLWRYEGGVWRNFEKALPHGASTFYLDRTDHLWLGHDGGRVGVLEGGTERLIPVAGSSIGLVCAISETTFGLMVAGSEGLALLHDGNLTPLHFVDPTPEHGITGLVQDVDGGLWLNGSIGVVHVPPDEVALAVQSPTYRLRAEVIREGEYVGPAPYQRGVATAAADTNGSVWLVMQNGIISVRPSMFAAPQSQPRLSIAGVFAEGIPLGTNREIAPHPHNVSAEYFGMTLTAPEKVVYRIKLDGADHDWQDVGSRDQALYLDLRPGRYTFHVMASLGDGKWTTPLTEPMFIVLPSFYQTWEFDAACGALLISLLWLFLYLRLRRVSFIIKTRAEERANERVRIARDLHDTLLQSVQGLLMSFHVAAAKFPVGDDVRKRLDKTLLQAERVIQEGRDRVTRLRSESITDSQLIEQFETVCAELYQHKAIEYVVERRGGDFVLTPHVADEVFSIGREALCNAFQHSQATSIVLTIDYSLRCFVLSCSDNGIGFPQDRSNEALRQGHWGLRGIYERAQRLGANCAVESGDIGTRIRIELTAHRAYDRAAWWRLRSLWQKNRILQ